MSRLLPLLSAAALLASPAAAAHSFGRLYTLPVPFWLYGWGAAAALLVSFAVVGFFIGRPATAREPGERDLAGARWVAALRRWRVVPALRALALVLLLLCIATGLLGTKDPYRNFNMTFFWVLFVLGFAYLTALAGDLWAAINPWRTLASLGSSAWRGFAQGRIAYPARLGAWPAVALYLAFIAIELLGHSTPLSLSQQLLGYTVLNLAGTWLVGAAAWFRHCELFSVFLRLMALMAPFDYAPAAPGGRGHLRWRRPFAGALQRAGDPALLVFVLFMLSSTAFDGLRATQHWFGWFWNGPVVTLLTGNAPVLAYAKLRPWFIGWELFWLLASPFLYLAVYLLFVALAKALGRGARTLRELALDFALTLLPIALVYNVTHYFTLVLGQGPQIVRLASDPFGWGWNLFGTARMAGPPFIPDIGWVWHFQVGLILAGHIASVVLAHVVALRVFPTPRRAVLSQLPMLGLMVIFTVFGLWILAQPLQSGGR